MGSRIDEIPQLERTNQVIARSGLDPGAVGLLVELETAVETAITGAELASRGGERLVLGREVLTALLGLSGKAHVGQPPGPLLVRLDDPRLRRPTIHLLARIIVVGAQRLV